jgi:hypothetical protein
MITPYITRYVRIALADYELFVTVCRHYLPASIGK